MYRMNKDVIRARKESGLARFERTTKGWKVLGSKEAEKHRELHEHMDKILRRIRGDKRYENYNLNDLQMVIKHYEELNEHGKRKFDFIENMVKKRDESWQRQLNTLFEIIDGLRAKALLCTCGAHHNADDDDDGKPEPGERA